MRFSFFLPSILFAAAIKFFSISVYLYIFVHSLINFILTQYFLIWIYEYLLEYVFVIFLEVALNHNYILISIISNYVCLYIDFKSNFHLFIIYFEIQRFSISFRTNLLLSFISSRCFLQHNWTSPLFIVIPFLFSLLSRRPVIFSYRNQHSHCNYVIVTLHSID